MPRTRLSDPPIKVRCDCGEVLRVAYGDGARCGCGRRYTTATIPADDYRRVASTVRLFRLLSYALAAVFALLVALVALTEPLVLVVLVPGGLLVWFLYLRPLVRRNYRRRVATFPTWQLHGERVPTPVPAPLPPGAATARTPAAVPPAGAARAR